MKIAVLGAGAWGTALCLSLAARHSVTLWVRSANQLSEMSAGRQNRRYLPDFAMPDAIAFAGSVSAAVNRCDLILVAVPSAGLRPAFREIAQIGHPAAVIWASKGFEAKTAKLPHQIAEEELPAAIPRGVLSGPSFAEEVARNLPAAVTLASNDAPFCRDMVAQLHSPRLRIYASDDVIGVEVAGAVKNVMAIAAGICDGMGLGHNARAALIARGLAEITRLGMKLGGKLETFIGLAGAGDLILTCTGDLSRNRQVGLGLAHGEPLAAILERLGHVAEGVYTAREVMRLADEIGVDMPLTRAVCRILHEAIPPKDALEELLRRDPKVETYG